MNRFATAAVCLITATASSLALAAPAVADVGGTTVVINEVYGGGGNSGATFTNDFVELYNPSGAAISLDGWSVQYASATGATWNATTLSGSIPSKGHYLVQEAKGAGGTEPLPTPDATGSLAMSGTQGKVALVSTATALTCGATCAADAGVVDFVGFGGANDFEGSAAAPGLSNATSDSRANGADTNDNAADFSAGAPSPENSGDSQAPTVTVTDPGRQTGTVGEAFGPLALEATGGQTPYRWSATGLPGGIDITEGGIISGTPTVSGTSQVTVTATDANDERGEASFTFEVTGPAAELTIAQIQGTDTDTSPYAGSTVTTTGVVTAAYPAGGFNGFYLQTAGTGGDDATPGASDAVFVYGSQSASQVTIGESVTVTGQVQEYQGTTEITSPTVTKLADPLPAVNAATLTWDQIDIAVEREAHEGELLSPQGDFTVSDVYDTNYYGSLVLAAGTTPLTQPTDVGTAGSAAAQAAVTDNARRAITLDDGSTWNYAVFSTHTGDPLPYLTADNHPRVGSAVSFTGGVILEYRFDTWNFQPTHQVTDAGADVATFSDARAQNEHPADVGSDIRLATFNVENYFALTGEEYVAQGLGTCTWYDDRAGNHIGNDRCADADGNPGPRGAATAESFARQQAKIVTGISRLDASIVSLEEIENSVKFGQDRDAALAGLVDALNAKAGSEVWAYVPSPDAADLPPVAQQDVIRTAFIYQPAQVSPVGVSRVLTEKSGPGQSFSIAREPLAQAFAAAGASDHDSFLVVANHFKSKGADADELFTDCANGGDAENTDPAYDQGAFNCTRVHEARDLAAFADETAAAAGTDKVFLLGDLNAYTHEDPLQALYDAGYTDLGSAFDPSEATYSYNSLSGSLDHVLANGPALKMVTGADVWQINAQEAVAYAYSRYNYNVRALFDGSDPFAASDHDPVIVGLTLPGPAAWDAGAVYDSGDLVTFDGSTWRALWWTQGQQPGDPWGAWEQLVTGPDGVAVWTPSRIFHEGDTVTFEGKTYKALYYTRNQKPGDVWGPWQEMATTADGVAVWTPSRVFQAGDVAEYQGATFEARWYTRGEAPGALWGPWVKTSR
ncbi:ExeM/NucH family extracellular endonuclease [Microbacterium protaetiae]|uniref:ExeM/NucH family extracellular endonuclease n=1 Tax=Microbacterium protaetiae TaxID=2509458 RepID=A0A4V0YD58_9MICO|nr:ExeM/NucH family extracellular endonuclease [Microbacterium protaetiae]QAY59561.1 ExeM/NucH family extracellular endonuclease [Microbacterium protaetiae]